MCTFCNNWTGKNKSSLAAHMRNCKFNSKNKDADASNILCNDQINEENTIIENLELNIQTITTEITNSKKTKNKSIKK
jgi:hypothetical protein